MMTSSQKKLTLPQLCGVLAVVVSASAVTYVLSSFLFQSETAPLAAKAPVAEESLEEAARPPESIATDHQLSPGSNMYNALRDANLSAATTLATIEAMKPHLDLKRVQAGLRFTLNQKDGATDPDSILFHLSVSKKLQLENRDGVWNGELIELPVTSEKITFSGVVSTNLWESAKEAGMDPVIIISLAEVFAWQVDFSREVRAGDRWRLVVKQLFVEGKSIGWGPILAAEYENAGETYSAVRFPQDAKYASYYAPDGTSLKRMFLKSPIKFGRITSRFKRRRFHPVLKRYKPHNGVDYGARTGTPVMSVGKGRIEFAGRKGASGIMVKIRHNSTYKTAYLHLSRIAKGIRKGRKVEQGQRIGYVGSTGLATGPHLHFAFYERGRFVDPLGRKFPAADPVPRKKLKEFKSLASDTIALLPDWQNQTETTML